MMTVRQVEQSLRELKLEVYLFGRKSDNVVDDPIHVLMRAVHVFE